MRKQKVSAFLIAVALCSFSVAAKADVSFTLKNSSKWDLHHLYLSDVDSKSWGPDQLQEETINSGESFTLRGIEEGSYDVRIVDEDGDECVVEDVEFSDSEAVKLTDEMLLGCQAGTDA